MVKTAQGGEGSEPHHSAKGMTRVQERTRVTWLDRSRNPMRYDATQFATGEDALLPLQRRALVSQLALCSLGEERYPGEPQV